MSQWVSSVFLVDWVSALRNAFQEDSAMVIKLLYHKHEAFWVYGLWG